MRRLTESDHHLGVQTLPRLLGLLALLARGLVLALLTLLSLLALLSLLRLTQGSGLDLVTVEGEAGLRTGLVTGVVAPPVLNQLRRTPMGSAGLPALSAAQSSEIFLSSF